MRISSESSSVRSISISVELGIRVLDLGSERCMARTIGLSGSATAAAAAAELSQGFNGG